jgi:hypothetical protein
MTPSSSVLEARRRRRTRQLRLLLSTPFHESAIPVLHSHSNAAAILRASSVLDEHELLASWRVGRQRLTAMAEFERRHAAVI